jgi:hypothetical protein
MQLATFRSSHFTIEDLGKEIIINTIVGHNDEELWTWTALRLANWDQMRELCDLITQALPPDSTGPALVP